ncbi:MAG: YndJ family transporter [Candidatus Acidiferrales bacterium]
MEVGLDARKPLDWVAGIGAAAWICLAFTAASSAAGLGLIEILFLAGPGLVVPIAATLVPPVSGSKLAEGLRTLQNSLTLPAAGLAGVSFFFPAGARAGILASAWLVVCVLVAGEGLLRLVSSARDSFAQLCFAVGQIYLVVGGSWLVISRLGLHPFGFEEPIVLLTAVHFHFAGFASCVLAGLAYERLRDAPWVKILRAALVGVVAGPGILCLAFLVGPKLKIVAALLIVAGQIGLSAAMLRIAFTTAQGLGRWMLSISAGCVAVGMALAATWAAGEYPLHPFVNLSEMARYHGVLNALGFSLCGLLGWTQVRSTTLSSGELRR